MKKIFIILVAFTIFISIFLPEKKDSIKLLTAALVGITAFYAWVTHELLEQERASSRAGIRPLIIATRLSERGEVGVYAGDEGLNRIIYLTNVGSGHAHRVNVRPYPPAEAYAVDKNGKRYSEGPIYVIQGLEMPRNSKRMWNGSGAFCGKNNWHYMYAEYEDMEGNQYYTIQSGYNVKTGEIKKLRQKNRKNDTDPFWRNEGRENWLDDIDKTLKEWALLQKELYKARTAK